MLSAVGAKVLPCVVPVLSACKRTKSPHLLLGSCELSQLGNLHEETSRLFSPLPCAPWGWVRAVLPICSSERQPLTRFPPPDTWLSRAGLWQYLLLSVSAGKSVHQQSWCGSGSSSTAGWQQEGPFKPSVVQMGTEVISWWCLFSNALLSQAPFLSFILSFEFAFASPWSHTICCFTVSWPFFPFPLQELLFCKSVAGI